MDAIILAFGEIGPDQQVSVDEIKESDIIKKVSTYKNTQSISKTIAIYLQRESKIDSETVYVKIKLGENFLIRLQIQIGLTEKDQSIYNY